MDDDTSQLKAHLKSLHANLANTGIVDAELQALLSQLDGDIHALLARRSAIADGDPADPALEAAGDPEDDPANDPSTNPAANQIDAADLASRTQELAARFAAEHPRVEPALRELGNILSSMGI